MSNIGYSGKSLREKLGFKDGMSIGLVGEPANYRELLGDTQGLNFTDTVSELDAIHIFAKEASMLKGELLTAMSHIVERGMIWVSWPKGSSKVPTDLNENRIRDIALPLGLVDIKVCAVDDTWSGLKLVRRKSPAKDKS